ncbi:hypothetical protein R6Q59_034102 [Mikania micrantha]
MQKKLVLVLFIEAIFIAAVVVATLTCCHTYDSRSMIVGLICMVFNILMYVSPLTVMKMVIKTKSVKYMPVTLALASFANSIVWCGYALLRFDPYILVPNVLGTLSSTVQLILYTTYYGSTNWDDNGDEQGEVQMSSTSKA